MACAAGQVCSQGACVTSCVTGLTNCAGSCRDTQTDRAHCGACGMACAAGQVCSAGACVVSCPTGQTECAGSCSDTTRDRANCGTCGRTCAAGEVCVAGGCVLSCPTGQTACSGTCRDTQTDRAHCGACGMACAAGQVCSAGACVTSCGAGLTNCGGTCRDTQTDRAHCGACNAACPGGQVCTSGACVPSCPAQQTLCSSACVPTNIDPTNCGMCGVSCPTRVNAAPVCAAGTCGYLCAAGFADCDLQAGNGCEVRPATDANHCGRCGNACPVRANATATCSGGACGSVCNTGFGDCNSNPADGCEVDTRASPSHCGACNNACPARANATATCTGSACGFTCNAGFADCNNNPADGCEVNTQTSATNCGACGASCSGTCTAGACQITGECRGGSNLLSRSPGGSVIVCDHPSDSVCEENFETLCPVGWSLCSRTQFLNRNAGWSYVPGQRVLGTIHCRNGAGAGHFTFGWSGGSNAMSFAEPMNCAFGSSRNTCTATYGCNEQSAFAMCCAPTPTCGNGMVDSPEELCDDGNQSNDDACLNNCTWRAPAANGVGGTSC
jgi:hypothetical protein